MLAALTLLLLLLLLCHVGCAGPAPAAVSCVLSCTGAVSCGMSCTAAAAVEYGQELAVVGADEALGGWDVSQCIPMAWNDGDVWSTHAEVPVG